MKARERWIVALTLAGALISNAALAQELPPVSVEALLPDGSAVVMPPVCRDQLIELMRAVGAEENSLGVPVIPREVTLRLTGEGLTSQSVGQDFRFGALDFSQMNEWRLIPPTALQIALDPTVPGAQRVRFPDPLEDHIVVVVREGSADECVAAAILEASPPLPIDMLAAFEADLAGAPPQQQMAMPMDTDSSIREGVARVHADMRMMATALEAYFIDCNAYPAWVGGANEQSVLGGNGLLISMPTFRRHEPGGPMTLTTPIAYVTSLFADPFNTGGGVSTYSYFSDDRGWILVSPGPDGDFDITPAQDYSGKTAQPGTALVERSYDPTNGTDSGGDLFRVKQ